MIQKTGLEKKKKKQEKIPNPDVLKEKEESDLYWGRHLKRKILY